MATEEAGASPVTATKWRSARTCSQTADERCYNAEKRDVIGASGLMEK
jgi:hypothetical protein